MTDLNKETPVVEEEKEQQSPAEVIPAEETDKKEENLVDPLDALLPGAIEVEPYTSEVEFNKVIEDARVDFNVKYNKSRRMSFIMMGIVMVVAIVAVIFVTLEHMAFKVIGWSLVIASILGMVIYYVLNRNKMPTLTQDYIKVINATLNSYTFTDPKISDVKVDPKEKIEVAAVANDGVYAEIGNIASRNVVKGMYNNHSFVAADLGLYNKETGKKQRSYFVGKYLSTTNDKHFTDRYIICSFSASPVDLPSDLQGLEAIISEANFIVYGKPGSKPEKDLGKEFINALKNINLNDTTLGFSVVVWAGRTIGYFSYSDEVMTLPFQSEFNGISHKKYKEDTIAALEAFDLLF